MVTIPQSMDDIIHIVLRGAEHVCSHEKASQYVGGGGTAACGLAALNCARVILGMEDKVVRSKDELLKAILNPEVASDITSICAQWPSNAHLEVEDIYAIPIFQRGLALVGATYAVPSFKKFKKLLSKLQDLPESNGNSSAIIITRPPEIITCFLIRTSQQQPVFVIFDSHPRPKHPQGAGFIFNTSIDATATYLSTLLSFDKKLLADSSMQWQAQLLANFSAHVFVGRGVEGEEELEKTLMDASLLVLKLQAEVRRLKDANSGLESENRMLEGEMREMKDMQKAISNSRQQQQEKRSSTSGIASSIAAVWPRLGKSSSHITPFTEMTSARTNVRAVELADGRSSDATMSGIAPPPLPHSSRAAEKQKMVIQDEEPTRTSNGIIYYSGEPIQQSSTRSPHASARSHDGHQASYTMGSCTPRYDNQGPNSISHGDGAKYYSGCFSPYPPSTSIRQSDPSTSASGSSATQLRDTSDPALLQALTQQREYEQEHERLLLERQSLLTLEQRLFSCGVCFDEFPEDFVARINGCQHAFCRDCLRGYILSKLGEHRYPILCPVCVAEKKGREPTQIESTLIDEIGIPNKMHEVYIELQLAAFSVLLHCAKCKQSAFVDRQELEHQNTIGCPFPRCNYAWCKNCQQAIVVGGAQHSCDGSNELDHLMQSKGWKHCPSCRTPIEKSSGCNHMTCMSPGCNTHFCYVCGTKIIQSSLPREIKISVSSHYRKCKLFEY